MIRFYVSVMCFVLLSFVSGVVYAQDGAAKIAIIDTQKIIKSSKAALSIREQVEAERKSFLKDLEKKENVLRAEEKALVEKKDSLSKDEFIKQRKVFEGKFLETNKFAKRSNRTLEEAYAAAMSKLHKAVFDIVKSIVEKQDYNLVLRRQDVFLATKTDDITDEVLKVLDAKTKMIKLEVKE